MAVMVKRPEASKGEVSKSTTRVPAPVSVTVRVLLTRRLIPAAPQAHCFS